jgi:hypothetical protein
VSSARDELVALAVLKPASGRAISGESRITAETLQEFAPDPADADAVARALARAGFRVGPLVGIGMSVTGPRATFERYCGVRLRAADDDTARELPVPDELADRVHALTFEPPAEAVTAP